MAKKSSKKDKVTAGAAEAVEAVRAAVERTFTASAEGAKSTRGRAKDVTAAANRIREVLEERVLEELKGLRGEVEGLAKRVSALEVGPLGGSSAPPRPAATRSTASTARKPSSAARKPASSPAARKPASSTGARKPASARKPETSSGGGTTSAGS